MDTKSVWIRARVALIMLSLILGSTSSQFASAQSSGPTMLHPRLDVRPVVSGLNRPNHPGFIGSDDILALEKNTGQVKRVVNGVVQGAVLDLAVNFGSERGLLGIALHPGLPGQPGRLPVLDRKHYRHRIRTCSPRPPCWATGWTALSGMEQPDIGPQPHP
jgi:hypothetical protein